MTTIIHAISDNIRKNQKPSIKIIRGKSVFYANEIRIKGESKIMYRPDKPLRGGAKLWIETEAELGIRK